MHYLGRYGVVYTAYVAGECLFRIALAVFVFGLKEGREKQL